ncbi:MAG: glycoside hydrolase family 2 TIM barrel-domain containing protein [Rudaea sp.]
MPPATPTTGRSRIDLDRGWRFRFGADAVGVAERDYADGAWQQVTIPHTWNRLGEYRLQPSDEANNVHGIGWYRLHFATPPRTQGRRQILQFDAVGNVADVWLNGIHLGQHRGAFARFRFDVTDALARSAADNVLVVRADNAKPEVGASTADVIPLMGDFFVHGGIYRGVSLIDADSAQIDLLDHAGPGVYITTPTIGADGAQVVVLARLRNMGARPRALSLAVQIVDAEGRTVAADDAPARLDGTSTVEVRRTLALAHPHLWQGRADPYLYSVAVELRERGKLVDRVVEPLGVRSFRFDANEGFFLNGKSTPLHGASRHQDRLGKGWALSPQDHEQDMAIMAEMGVNTVRHAHYQHAQEWVDAADKTGMVVWAEVPFVSEASLTNETPTQALVENAKAQLVELIRQQFNHPSIMIWSVGNESDIRPTQLGLDRPAQSLGLLETLNRLAKQEDPSRVTGYADCCEDAQAVKGSPVLSNVADITGYNRYFGWYYGQPAQLGTLLDKFHARYPNMPIAVSEYGAGGALTQHTDNPRGGPVNLYGRPHPEEYESWVHEESWKELESRHYLSAVWIWNMFDFASDVREEGDAIYLNDKGLVTDDRKLRKDVFYFYQAQWSSVPVLHITSRRYTDRAYPFVEVRVYSNADRATLTVNGESRGEAACPGRICVWPEVALRAGHNEVAVGATISGKALSDRVEWNAPDVAAGVRIAAGTLTGFTGADAARFGSDNFFVGGDGKSLNPPTRPGIEVVRKVVTGQGDLRAFESCREGTFRYEIPLANRKWRVTLYFAEPDAQRAAARTFTVAAQGKRVLARFDVAAAAGGALKTLTRSFPVVVGDGHLTLAFTPEAGPAIVSAIAIAPE